MSYLGLTLPEQTQNPYSTDVPAPPDFCEMFPNDPNCTALYSQGGGDQPIPYTIDTSEFESTVTNTLSKIPWDLVLALGFLGVFIYSRKRAASYGSRFWSQ